MSNYTVSTSISILDTLLNPFSFDHSIRDITLLLSSSGAHHSSTKYFLNNTILPITVILLWFLSIVLILVRGGFSCCLRRSFSRIKQGSSRGVLGGEEENKYPNHSALHLVTIASDRKELINGTIEDQVNYEILRAQMRRVRNSFLSFVVVTVMTSIPALLSILYLKDSYNRIMRETNYMTYRLDTAAEAMNKVSGERDTIVDISAGLIASLGSQSFQSCFNNDNDLIEAASEFSSSLLNMNEDIDATNMQALEDLYRDGGDFSSDVATSLNVYSLALLFLISSIVALDVASLALFCGTLIAKRNENSRSHHILFQCICFPFFICVSFMLLLGGAILILIGYVSVDFCATMGSPTDAILAILTAKGYNGTDFYSVAKDIMQVRF